MTNRTALLVLLFGAFALWADQEEVLIPADVPGIEAEAAPVRTVARAREVDTARAAPPETRRVVTAPQVTPTAVAGPGGSFEVAAGEILFRVAPGTDRAALQRELRHAGALWVGAGAAGLWRATFGPAVALDAARDAVAGVEGTVGLRPNAVVRGASCGSYGLKDYQWARVELKGSDKCPDEAADAPVVIALLDTGVAYEDHGAYVQVPELAGVPVVAPWDFVNGDAHANDDHQHGTHLAGVIASRDQLYGHAPNPVLMPVKVLDHEMVGTEWTLVEGLYWAVDQGAEVINLSLTFGLGYLPSPDLAEALSYAEDAGVVVVAAAGNAGASEQVAYPAAFHSVIAVGGAQLKADGTVRRASYSNRGWAVDVASAGGRIDRDRNDDGIADGLLAQTISPGDPAEVGYWVMAGTSQAAAVVSAQAARALGQGILPQEVRDVLVAGRTNWWTGGTGITDKAGSGVPGGDDIEDWFPQDKRDEFPDRFVNAVVGIESVGGGSEGWRAVARVGVVDAAGTPMAGVRVYGSFEGSATSTDRATTDSAGEATLVSDVVSAVAGDPLLFLFRVDGVRYYLWGDSSAEYHYPTRPGGFYRLSEGNAQVMAAALGATDGGLLLSVDPADGGPVCQIFDCSDLALTYNARSLGGGFGSSTVHLAFNHPYLAAAGGAGFGSSTVPVGLTAPAWFPWGTTDEGEFTEVGGSGFGSSTVGVIRWDPSLFGSGFGSSTVSLLSYDPGLWGSGFGSSTVGLLVPGGPVWGNGFGSSTVHGLRRAPGVWGNGFGSSTVHLHSHNWRLTGSGFGSSAVGALTWNWGVFGAATVSDAAQASGAGAVPADNL